MRSIISIIICISLHKSQLISHLNVHNFENIRQGKEAVKKRCINVEKAGLWRKKKENFPFTKWFGLQLKVFVKISDTQYTQEHFKTLTLIKFELYELYRVGNC